MFSLLNHNRTIYIFSNLLVLPAAIIPCIDLVSNFSFILGFFLSLNTNLFLSIFVSLIFILKNNSNYRFKLLLKQKGDEVSKSDYECVYLYAWCTLLRYFLMGIAVNRLNLFLK